MKTNKYNAADRKEYRRLWMRDFRKNHPDKAREYAESHKRKVAERQKALLVEWNEGKLNYYPGPIRKR